LIDDEIDVRRQARTAWRPTRCGPEQVCEDSHLDGHENDHHQEQRDVDPGRNVSHLIVF
jgi:hypothetical protein